MILLKAVSVACTGQKPDCRGHERCWKTEVKTVKEFGGEE